MKRSIAAAAILLSTAFLPGQAGAEETVTRLDEVVVTATRTEKDPDDVTQAVTVIKGEDIRRTGATDVATAVQEATSTHVIGYGGPGSLQSLTLRGSSSAQVLVLVNGIRMNSARDGGFDLSLLPVSIDDIDRIEIVRGAASALYGSDAEAGVINIITRKPAALRNNLKGTVGSHGYDNLFLSTSGKQDSTYYSLSANRETYDGYRQNSDLRQWIFGGRVGYDISPTQSVELSVNYLANEVGVPGHKDFPSLLARQQERNGVFSGSYKGKVSSSLDLKLSAYRKQDDLSYTDPDWSISNRSETTTDGGEAQTSWLFSSWNQLVAGYEIRKDSTDSFDLSAGTASHSATLKAYYLQDEISIGEPLIIVLGARHDDHSVYGGQTSPKASARYSIASTGTIIRASYGKGFRAPTFNDLYTDASWGKGDPNLKPETSREYEAGIEQKAGKAAALKITGFNRIVIDLIDWDLSTFPTQVGNIGRAHIRGAEAELTYRFDDTGSHLLINYAYTNPVDETTGEKIYYKIAQKQAKAVLTWFVEENVYLTLEGRAVDNYVKQGEPDFRYSVMDAKIAERFGQGTEVFFGMNNIFDRQYDAWRGYPAPPREIRGGLSFLF